MKKILLCLLIFTFTFPQLVYGTTNRFSIFGLSPAIGEKNFFSISSTEVLNQYQSTVDLFSTYTYRSLDRLNASGDYVSSAMPHSLGHFFSVGFGINEFWQAGMTLPVFSWVRFQDPTVSPAPATTTVTKLGDLRFSMKEKLPSFFGERFGIGFEEFLTVPSGSENHHLGNKEVTGGVKLINDINLLERLKFSSNLGVELRSEPVLFNNIDFQHRFLAGGGLVARITEKISASVETQAKTAFKSFFSEKDTTPVEFLGGIRYKIGETRFIVGAGGGTCGTCGAESPRIRGFLSLSYHYSMEPFLRKRTRENNQ